MSKQIIEHYTFSKGAAGAGTVTFNDFTTIALERVLLITDVTANTVIYQFNNAALGGSATNNVLTLDTDTSALSNTDSLQIIYQAGDGDPEYNQKQLVGNARAKFRDGFAAIGGTPPNPAIWDTVNTDHVLTAGGNSAGSSYLRISLNPLVDASEVNLTSKQSFAFPLKAGFGISMSQRIIGQEVFVGLVGTDANGTVETTTAIADINITGATATISSNVATLTITNHGLKGGDRVNIVGCREPRLNVGPVVVTVVTKDTFTVPCTLANGTYSTVGGIIRVTDPLKFNGAYATNGVGLLYETTSATTASFVSRRGGDKFRSVAATVATTTASQTNTSPYTDAFNSANVNELYGQMEDVSYRSFASDSVGGNSGQMRYVQSVPEEDKEYKLHIRARNLAGITIPIARITAISKTGTTTATVTTDVPHGLATTDFVQIYGVLNQAASAFPALTAQTAVASVIDETHFTVVIGTAATVSSQDGTVYKNEGSMLAPGVYTQAVQSMSCTSNVLTLIGSGTWATPIPGEYVWVHGLTAGHTAKEGAYKVLRVSTTTLELEAPLLADFTSVTTGGTVIRMTDVRLHFVRCMPYTRLVSEIAGGKGSTTDVNNSVPVSITGGAAIPASQTTGTSSTAWSAAGWGGFLVTDIASAAITTTTTTTAISPGSVVNIGTYAHSFHIAVTATSGTNQTMDVQVQESPDNGTNWIPIYDFPRITATGSYQSPLIRATWGTRYRYVQTIAGTTPSFTRVLNRLQFSSNPPLIRQFIDRSITLTSLNSVTPTYFVDGIDTAQLVVNVGAITTTAPQLQLEGSDDTTSWYAIGSPLTAVASSTVVLNYTGIMPKYIRVRVSTAGVGVTAGYVAIKGTGR